ncbi:MAG: acyl transferase [Bacteroidetes bacterium]|nr:acyl transferase [Bacteroidota bacterium]
MEKEFTDSVFNIGKQDFSRFAIDLFNFQYQHNHVYKLYVDSLNIDPGKIKEISHIPFLPIGSFKTHRVQTTSFAPEIIFESSGTTQSVPSKHYVKKLSFYRRNFLNGFEKFYGQPSDWCIIGLLPSYLEREHSSLVLMVDELIKKTNHPKSGFYLYEHEQLFDVLASLEKQKKKTLLIGVTFALLDFAEKFPMQLNHTIVMETGGMKGRRKEMTRIELHDVLKKNLGLKQVHSEFGMTELLSQAYSRGEGIFEPVPWMKILLRDDDDPFQVHESGEGIINIIDLGNIYSCAFIATDDLGRISSNGLFEVLGRTDNSDMRGCSLLFM